MSLNDEAEEENSKGENNISILLELNVLFL